MLIKVTLLNEYPEYAPILAHWTYNEWYKNRSIDFKIVLKFYQSAAKNNKPPLSFVALHDTYPVGMVSLKDYGIISRKDLSPWLSSLYVISDYRKNGIGSMLISSLNTKAKELGFKKNFLFFGDINQYNLEDLYRKRGWSYFSNSVDNDGYDSKIFYTNL